MGVGGFRVAKYDFYDKNGIVLVFLEPKRRRFSHHSIFKILHIYQNNVVLDCEGSDQCHFESVVTYSK